MTPGGVDEPAGPIEDRILHELIVAIARGVHRAGDILPPEDEVAHAWLVSPRKVGALYARLAADGVAVLMDGHGYMVEAEGPRRARERLLERCRRAVARSAAELVASGCSREEIEAALARAIADAVEGSE